MNYVFVECQKCSEKSGTPVLCASCLTNRSTIDKLKRLLAEEQEKMLNVLKILGL